MNFDTLIRHARVFDGTGAPEQRLDVGLRGARIAALGDLGAATAGQTVDAAGLVLAPGFIDAHSHSDAFLLIEPDAPSKVSQGVTTEIVGQCGASAAPQSGRSRMPSDWAALRYPRADGGVASAPGPTWTTVASYRRIFEQVRPAVNAVLFVGHNTLRSGAMGYDPRPAGPDDVAAMQRMLEQALDEGGSGLSTGLIYEPGRHAQPEEVLALARTAAARGGLYATHMRSEGARLLEALDEVLALGRATGMRVQISHLKTSGRENWSKLDAALTRIESARQAGLAVHADRYPYLASGTDLDVVLPEWAGSGGREAILARFEDPAVHMRLAAELEASRPAAAWDGVMVGGTVHPELHACRGRTVAAIARERGASCGETVLWILRRDALRTSAFFFGMCEANMRRIYAQPWVMVGSDASIRAPQGPLGADHPHPRAYGTFPRFLRLAQDEKLMSLAEAIRRLTSLPAAAFGLNDRGQIAVGMSADLALFDPDALRDLATYAQPHAFAAGVRQVWVNGDCCYADGHFTGVRRGQVLSGLKR